MDLTKKATILLSLELADRLSRLATTQGRSLGDLVREACEWITQMKATVDGVRP